MLKSLIRNALDRRGFMLVPKHDGAYDEDGLRTHHNHDFINDPVFAKAYARGVKGSEDYHFRWRAHVGLWAAATAVKLPGDFVECGVNRGFISSAIMDMLDWDTLDKTFWLLDTFDGIDEEILSPEERAVVRQRALIPGVEEYYVHGVESVRSNFAEWSNVRIIVGSVPGTLDQVQAEQIAYLHIDMNNSVPEIAALDFFWPRLVAGATVLLDDYAYSGYEPQYRAMNAFAAARDVKIASLPTGQGLLVVSGR